MMQTNMTFDEAIAALKELREEWGFYLWFSDEYDTYVEAGLVLDSLSQDRRAPTKEELEVLIHSFNYFAHAGVGDRGFDIAERARDALDYLHRLAGLEPPAR